MYQLVLALSIFSTWSILMIEGQIRTHLKQTQQSQSHKPEARSYQSLTASGDHLNGVYELRADRFYCDETSLLEFVLSKLNLFFTIIFIYYLS